MSVSTLPSAGGLDVNELSQKLSTIPAVQEEGVVPEGAEPTNFREEESDETSSTAAVFGSEGGVCVCVCVYVCVCVCVCTCVHTHIVRFLTKMLPHIIL